MAFGSLGAAALRPAAQVGRRVFARPVRWAVLSTLDTTLGTLDAVLQSQLADEIGERIRTSSLAVDVVAPLVQRAIESPEAERLITELVDSRLIGAMLRELPDNDGLWALVDEIAQSPAVTEAISHQGMSFADQMAGVVRKHSRNADDRAEQLARRIVHRRQREPADDDPPPPDAAAPGTH